MSRKYLLYTFIILLFAGFGWAQASWSNHRTGTMRTRSQQYHTMPTNTNTRCLWYDGNQARHSCGTSNNYRTSNSYSNNRYGTIVEYDCNSRTGMNNPNCRVDPYYSNYYQTNYSNSQYARSGCIEYRGFPVDVCGSPGVYYGGSNYIAPYSGSGGYYSGAAPASCIEWRGFPVDVCGPAPSYYRSDYGSTTSYGDPGYSSGYNYYRGYPVQ